MGATSGDVSSHAVSQNINDRSPVFSKHEVKTKTKVENATGVCVDVLIPVSGKGKVVTKVFNGVKEEAELPPYEGAAATAGAISFKLAPGYSFECTITEAVVGEAVFQT
jgi:hypothetical protein